MQPQGTNPILNKATEYVREMQQMADKSGLYSAGISDINHIHQKQNSNSNNYNRNNNSNNSTNSYAGFNNLFNISGNKNKNDNDLTLILALILLLSRDGGDRMLIFALLYIIL